MDRVVAVRPPSSTTSVLFCPFCRESFEGEAKCPEHELALVPFEQLPGAKNSDDLPRDDELLSVFDLRFGRGLVGAGAMLAIAGFLCPVGSIASAAETLLVTGPSIAVTHAPTLWVVPGVGIAALALLAMRRTLVRMRAIRLVVPLLAWGVPMSVWSAVRKLDHWAALVSTEDAVAVAHYGWGLGVLGVATLLMIVGGLRLGVTKEPTVLPHGAEPDAASSRIEIERDDDAKR
jgi:hypothetical protein